MKQKRIAQFSTTVMVGLLIFLVYYPYRFFTETIPFAFTKPELWQEHWMVHHDVLIPFSIRSAYFAIWMLPVLATIIMTLVALYFFHLIRQGIYFDPRTVRSIQLMGICAAVSGAGVMLGYSLTPWLLTIMNAEDKRGIHFGYEPTEVGLVLTGLGLFMAGWIWNVVVLKAQENKEFV